MTTTKFPAIRQRIAAARTNLILDEPFFGTLALKLRLVEDEGCNTAWVDGVSMGYNPKFIEGLKSKEITALVCHEVMHCAAGHPWRRDGREFKAWNEACDRAINPVLRDSGFELPKDGLYELDPSHKGKSAEWIFDRLGRGAPDNQSGGAGDGDGKGKGQSSSKPEPSQSQPKQGQGQGQPSPQTQAGQGSGKGSSRPQAGQGQSGAGTPSPTPKSPATGQDRANADGVSPGHTQPVPQQDHKSDRLGEVRDAPETEPGAGEDAAPSEADWREAVSQAATLAKGQGKLPGDLKRFAKDNAKSYIDWRSALRRFAQESAKADYSFARPNPRYVAAGMLLPSLRNHEVGIIAVGVDTSGSIDQVLLNQFAAEIRSIADEVRPRQIRVLYADARVCGESVFERDDVIELKPNGGGGTDFRPVFAEIEKWDEPPVAVLYLTDLLGTFPEEDPGLPTMWVTGGPARRVPFGDVISTAQG